MNDYKGVSLTIHRSFGYDVIRRWQLRVYSWRITMTVLKPPTMPTEDTFKPCLPSTRNTTTCPHGFRCVHGDCNHEPVDERHESGAVRIKCACDHGWSGTHCDRCCDLECNFGDCDIINGSMSCHCLWGYEGNFCNETTSLFPILDRNMHGEFLVFKHKLA